MPNSQPSSHQIAKSLRSYLETKFPESDLNDAVVIPPYEPLLLLRTGHVLAAFAFSNGDMAKSYEAIYQGFKTYFAEQKGLWDSLDVAFVFCVPPGLSQIDRFCSRVETDVYFCRKFVVPLEVPVGTSLARLPFFPLTPLSGHSLRPPSAQTFLNQCGVPATLSRFLVVQHQRGPDNILEDCINGVFGEPSALSPTRSTPVTQTEQRAAPINLESITIKNFRAYREPQKFDLGADVTVLYGANGFGKTSLFDAFDFAATGEIGRIRSLGDEHFKKTAPHLDSKPEDSTVSLSFWEDGALRKLTRSVADRKFAQLDGVRTDRKKILSALTTGEFPGTDRIENFVSLFRATHLFNQERPELTKDFHEHCRLPSEIVARMLAFEDYASAVTKASKVKEAVGKVIASADIQIKELSEQIAEETAELERLGKTANTTADADTLALELKDLSAGVAKLGIAIGEDKPNAAALRSWRASLEARNATSQGRIEKLSKLAKEVADLAQSRITAIKLQEQLSAGERLLSASDEKNKAVEAAIRFGEAQLTELRKVITSAQNESDIAAWIATTKPVYTALAREQVTAKGAVARLTEALNHTRVKHSAASKDVQQCDAHAIQREAQVTSKRAELSITEKLLNDAAGWLAGGNRLVEITQAENSATKTLDELRAESQELESSGLQLAGQERMLSRAVDEAEKDQSKLQKLVSELSGLVRTGTCPVCGEDHGSKDELVERIQAHLSREKGQESRAELSSLRNQIATLTERKLQNGEKQQAIEIDLKNYREQRSQIELQAAQFADALQSLGITLGSSEGAIARQLDTRRKVIAQELQRSIDEANAAKLAAAASRLSVNELSATVDATVIELETHRSTQQRLQSEIASLREDPRLAGLSLDSETDELAAIGEQTREKLAEARSKFQQVQDENTNRKKEEGIIKMEMASSQGSVSALRSQLSALQKTSSQTSARLHELGLPPDVNENGVLARMSDESTLQEQILSLRDAASVLELAFDTVTTSAALTQLRHNVRNKEKVVADAIRTREQHRPWAKYFNEVASLVASQQSEAITSFTREYGPRTSVIQRRLRSVYGFDDVEIQSRDSEISVRVKRDGEDLRPTDFFSQSQQQTLFLGLFLTACISQTWSAFSPIFLDDPVTHFDDLNTYAFLDLILGLLEPFPSKRQFVISTCDEKLLQLARHKFRHLGDGAKFYRFDAIGKEGPSVAEVPSRQ